MNRIIHSAVITVPLLAILIITCAIPIGCNRDGANSGNSNVEIPPYGTPEHYGYLLRTRTTRNKHLQEELSRIEGEGEMGMPDQLTDTEKLGPDGGGDGIAAAEIANLFPPQALGAILRSASEMFPEKGFEFASPEHLSRAIEFRERYDTTRKAARKIADLENFRLHVNLLQGMFADLTFIDVAWTCAYLEAYYAAEALYVRHDPDDALEAVAYMLRWATFLGNEPHQVTRLEAAYLRTEAMKVLLATLESKYASPKMFRRANKIVFEHLKRWPDESIPWRGERAIGLHTYEVARQGDLNSLLEPDEFIALAETLGTDNLDQYIYSNINTDELFYLSAMRRLIAGMARPYFERKFLFSTFEDELDQGDKRKHAALAANILLKGLERSHAVIAEDRANWEAIALALAVANYQEPPPYKTNPRTGNQYLVTKYDDSVTVDNIAPIDQDLTTSISIPIPQPASPAPHGDVVPQPTDATVPRAESSTMPR